MLAFIIFLFVEKDIRRVTKQKCKEYEKCKTSLVHT